MNQDLRAVPAVLIFGAYWGIVDTERLPPRN